MSVSSVKPVLPQSASAIAPVVPFKSASIWPGLLLTAAVAGVSWVLGGWMPKVGAPLFAILLGIVLRNTLGLAQVFKPGVVFASKKVLQWSIIFLGFGLSFSQVIKTGLESIWVTLITITVAFTVAAVLGRWLKVADKIRTLVGAGTAICGGSAIAAIALGLGVWVSVALTSLAIQLYSGNW